MTKQKIEFDAECFGTIDKEKKAHCNHCDYSEQCTEFKPKLVELKAAAVENYKNDRKQQKQKIADKKEAEQNHILVVLIVFAVLAIVFWLVLKS